MGKKKVNYILIPAVALIWGAIIYNIASGLSDDDDTLAFTTTPVTLPENKVQDSTFTLFADYRDPFLRGAYRRSYSTPPSQSGSSGTRNAKPKPKEEKPVTTINWSIIRYHGKIKNQDDGTLVGIMTINGKDYLMEQGDTRDEVKLVQLAEDSVKVFYQKEYAFIKKD